MNATPDQVWEVLADGWLYPLWVVGASRMREVDDGWPAVGARLHHSVGTWPLLIDDETESVECEPGVRLVLHAHAWPAGRATVTLRLSPVGADTEVSIEEQATEGPGCAGASRGPGPAPGLAQRRGAAPARLPGGATTAGGRVTDLDLRGTSRVVDFEGLSIEYDERVLEPRAWTAEQSRWAAELIQTAPPGPVLELCSGAGHIGLLAVTLAPRSLVCVDADPAACEFLRRNAARAGVRVDVREGPMTEVLAPDERFAVVIADPPWVSTVDVGRYPEDPVTAIDGGADGLDLVRLCLDVIEGHLAPDGSAILQVGPSQVGAVEDLVADRACARGPRGADLRAGCPAPDRPSLGKASPAR